MAGPDYLRLYVPHNRTPGADTATNQPLNPFAAQPGFIGGFIESAMSSLPEMVGYRPTDPAVQFRAEHPVAGFVSEVLPTMAPYGGMFALSQTARGAAALSKGMRGAEVAAKAVGLGSLAERPVISGAVKEMLRYSPLELGRLGVGAYLNPDNVGNLFADVALSTAFAGGFGGIGGYLREGGKVATSARDSVLAGQENMFAHPVVDLRHTRLPEVQATADPVARDALEGELTRSILNDPPIKSKSGAFVPLIQGVKNGTDRTAIKLNTLLKPNRAAAGERSFDRRKLWEGDPKDNTTLNPGELDGYVKGLGFETPTDLAENVLAARGITINPATGPDPARTAKAMLDFIDDPAIVSVGDGIFAAQTDTGATFLLKRVSRQDPESIGAKIDEAVAAKSPAEDAAAQVDLPPVSKETLDDAGFTGSEIRDWLNGKANPEQIELVRQGHVFRGGEMVPATDEVVAAARRTSDQAIAGLRARAETIAKSDKKLVVPWGDSKPMPKADALDLIDKAIGTEMDQVTKVMRQNERWRFSQNAAPEMPKPALSKRGRKAGAKPSLEAGPFRVGDKWAAILTDRPGAFVRDLEKLNATNKQTWATMRRMFQPMGDNTHRFNQADDIMLHTVEPLDIARMSRQSKKTWVAETVKNWSARGMRLAGLESNYALRNYADHLFDVFAPAMFKERRNSLYARYSGLLENRLRMVRQEVAKATLGPEGLKEGARGTFGRNFERKQIDGQMAFREALAQLDDDEVEVVIKALVSQTPAKEVKKLAKDGVISEQAFRAVQRMQEINAQFMNDIVMPALGTMKEKANFDLLEGYVIPRILLGDWRMKVADEAGNLVYLASGKTRAGAERMAKAIVEEAESRGVKYKVDESYLKHAADDLDSSIEKVSDLMEDVGKRVDRDPEAADIVQSAMKRVRFMNISKNSKLPYQPRTPGSLANKRTGIKATETTYTREELIKAFEANLSKMGNFAAVHSYMERWGNEIMALREQNEVLYKDVMRRAQQAMGLEGPVTRYLNETLGKFLGPQMGSKAATKIAAATNATMYTWQLAFVNPTFALLNALSPLQTVLPQLAFVMRAPSLESNRLLHHVPLLGPDGKPIGQGAFLDPIKVMWEATRQLRHADPDLQAVHTRLRNDGTLHPMYFEENVGLTASTPQTLKESFQSGGWARFLYDGSTLMARKSEDFARIVSANAGYLVGRDHLLLEGEQLYHFTRRFVESTNYLYGQSDRARIITGPIGSMFGLFKNWQMHFMGMMATYAGLAVKHNVYAPLLWQMGTALSLGGLGATPLKNAADGLSSWFADEPDSYLWMQENWPDLAADVTYFGPMGALGISLQASSSIPGTDVRNDMQGIFNSVVWERMTQLGSAVGEAWAYADQTGQNPMMNSNIRDAFLAAAAPRAVSRAASVVEGNYVKSMGTGYPQVQDVSYTGRVMHGLGMNAIEIEKHQVAARRLWKDQEARKQATTYHGKAFAAARAAGDSDTMHEVLLSARAKELDLHSVMRSAANFQRREEGDLLARYKSESSQRYRRALQD